jgi:hypothetical protein
MPQMRSTAVVVPRSPRAIIACASFAVVATLAAGATACGGKKSADAAASDSAAAAAPSTTTPVATTPASNQSTDTPLEVADIDRWQRGMHGELEAVHKAGESMRNAKNTNDSTAAMFAANETATVGAGASAAGVSESRYQTIRTTLGALAAELAPIEAEMDVSKMPAAAVDQLKKSREASAAQSAANLPPALVDALKPRAAELRKQSLALLAERMKAAGLAK